MTLTDLPVPPHTPAEATTPIQQWRDQQLAVLVQQQAILLHRMEHFATVLETLVLDVSSLLDRPDPSATVEDPDA